MKAFDNIPKHFKNFYVLFGIFFLFWMLLIDSNDLISQWKLSRKLKGLESEKVFYTNKKQEVLKDRKELLTDKELLEKFARENYLMKKPSEDLYIVVED